MGKIIRVSMADIARRAGVCQATVSLALRQHRSISESTRSRIARIAAQMGYEPNGAISTLMARVRIGRRLADRGTLGAIIFWRDSRQLKEPGWFTYRAFFEGARERAAALGYDFDPLSMCEPGMTTDRLTSILRTRGIEGVVIFPVNRPEPLMLDWNNLAGATVGYSLKWPLLHRAASDQYEAVNIALRNLRARGYERIGLAVDKVTNDRLQRRWLAAFCAHEFSGDPRWPGGVVLLEGNREKAFGAWVRRHRPDAILFGQCPAQEWLANLGLRAPQDVGLVCLSAVFKDRGCAHVDERSDQVGAAAIDLLVGQLQRNERGIPACQHELFVVGRWVDGNTVRPAPEPARVI